MPASRRTAAASSSTACRSPSPPASHTAIVGPNGAGKSVLLRLLTHEDRAIARDDDAAPVRVFGSGNWHVFELRSQLGIVSADMHQRFVAGNSEGRISAEAAVLSAFGQT
jgi:iron complex transport system ATP-binding protein